LPFADLAAEELLPVVAEVEGAVAPVTLAPGSLEGRLATCGPRELPHAARASAGATTSTTSPKLLITGAPRRLVSPGGWVLSRIAVSLRYL
jgi:hypothetical protein